MPAPTPEIATLLRDLVPTVGMRCVLRRGGAVVAEIVAEVERDGALHVHRFPAGDDGELVLWSDGPLAPLAVSLARSVAAHAASLHLAHAADARARASEHERDRAVTMIGHELRTPLQTLMTGIDLVVTRLRATADEAPLDWLLRRCEQLERSVDRLAALSDHLLAASRLGASSASLALASTRIDAGDAVDQLVLSISDDAAWAECAIDVHKSGDLDGPWDRGHLDRVLANLVGNACKYGAGMPVTIEVAGAAAFVELRVRDRGPGIAPDDLPRIFDRFYRGRNGSRASGIGVGLWIVSELVRALGGRIDCESVVGAGTTFTVTLPREPGVDLRASPRAPARPPPSGRPPGTA